MDSLDFFKAEIYQMYIAEGRTLNEVRAKISGYGFHGTPKQYKRKLDEWGFFKNYKRSDVLWMLRTQRGRSRQGKESEFLLHGRPIDVRRLKKFQARERLSPGLIGGSTETQNGQLICRTPPPLQPAVTMPNDLLMPERLLYDLDALIKRSFETKQWQFMSNELLIDSSRATERERRAIFDLNRGISRGCQAMRSEETKEAFSHWNDACGAIRVLVQGTYHDIVPNVIAELVDLADRGYGDVAQNILNYISALSRCYEAERHPSAAILARLGGIHPDQLGELEEGIWTMFKKLFDLYLGEQCYNTFVMMMNRANRKLERCDWARFEDYLSDVSDLDQRYGQANRRPLDVLRIRARTLVLRGEYKQAEKEAMMIVTRGASKHDNDWQRLYFCIKGWRYAALAQFELGEYARAEASFTRALNLIHEFRKIDSGGEFDIAAVSMTEAIRNCQNALTIS